MARARVRSGGCFCKAIRYRVIGEPLSAGSCHCLDCRKTSGAPFQPWAEFARKNFMVTKGRPKSIEYRNRRRAFCGRCGSPLTFESLASPASLEVNICTLDRPETVAPTGHIWVKRLLPWVKLNDRLPRYREGSAG